MAKRKSKKRYEAPLTDEEYDKIAIKSGKERWKVASFLSFVLRRLLAGDEAAEFLLDEHKAEKRKGKDETE